MFLRTAYLYLSSIVIYSLALLILFLVPYYQNTLSSATYTALLVVYALYLLCAPFYYFFAATRYSENKPFIVLHGLVRRQFGKEEKTASLFLLVKFFFLPLMINFFFNNLQMLFTSNLSWYPLLFISIFTMDTLIFAFGYTFEFRSLKNVVRSVEPTLLGWAVALASYPPFNGLIGQFIPWGAHDYAYFWNDTLTILFRVSILLLLILYVWATFALGAKASNLTNRGIVMKFPYSVIRHPAYVSKNLVWWLTLLPVLSWPFALGMLFWSFIYYLRAMTEERHLGQDAEYREYQKKVRYKFIPYVW